MILEQLDSLKPRRPSRQLSKLMLRKKQLALRFVDKTYRKTFASIKRQYYPTTACMEALRAFKLNEDIILGCLIIMTVLSYSAVTILANALYTFMWAANTLSDLLGANLIVMAMIALSVIAISLVWLAAFLHNLLAIALMQGLNRKRNRSLILTIRQSLYYTSRTASAWVTLAVLTFIPAMFVMLLPLVIAHFADSSFEAMWRYLLAACSLGVIWVLWVLAHYTLTPYVMLFENIPLWTEATARSRQLVQRKGRVFILTCYAAIAPILISLYAFVMLMERTMGSHAALMFAMLSTALLPLFTVMFTMLYRKRKLAKKQ